ncbi:MAG: F0F1 ATP synthase subunit delta [Microgenomates group bacterium]|nr:F0F1 ATP synthase subunit delta [Candidatus Woesebacteria bacterium]MBP6883379.1 F0F1 ATP synthase subunit delta [Candidatus Woesebacteria bacterium]QQR64370.1 MAG: F0F1 ATP synthase subunit delta [Candidatus Roizmanbacteria bacterium]
MKISSLMKEELKKHFLAKLKQRNDEVTIVSAYPLSSSEIEGIKKIVPDLKLSKINNEVDEKLIAGYIIRKGSKMIDLSLQQRLAKLQQLSHEAL